MFKVSENSNGSVVPQIPEEYLLLYYSNRLKKTKISVSLSLTVNFGSPCFAGVIRQEKKKTHRPERN